MLDERRYDIDALRSIALFILLIYHLGQSFTSLAPYIHKVVLILVPHHFLAFHCLTLPDLAPVQLVVFLELHPLAIPLCAIPHGVVTLHLALPLTQLHALLLLGHLLLPLNALHAQLLLGLLLLPLGLLDIFHPCFFQSWKCKRQLWSQGKVSQKSSSVSSASDIRQLHIFEARLLQCINDQSIYIKLYVCLWVTFFSIRYLTQYLSSGS